MIIILSPIRIFRKSVFFFLAAKEYPHILNKKNQVACLKGLIQKTILLIHNKWLLLLSSIRRCRTHLTTNKYFQPRKLLTQSLLSREFVFLPSASCIEQ